MAYTKSTTLYSKVHNLNTLMAAWETVKKNGRQSESEVTRKLIKEFDYGSRTKIKNIKDALQAKKFNFQKSVGVPIPRTGKDDRPLVVSPIENRIVQRALLVILQKEEGVKALFHQPTSFGGIEKRSVELALRAVVEKVNGGAKFYVRSDIVSFFTKIPKEIVLSKIFSAIPDVDEDFKHLLTLAVNVELANMASLAEKVSLFPLGDTGVAQGSCLSPLLGNIFLHEFDKTSNTHDVSCIRFIDDYVILGPTAESVRSIFVKGKKHLSSHGLEVYEPYEKNEKGKQGSIQQPFDFLGCEFQPGRIQPSSKSIEKLRKKILDRIHQSLNLNSGATFADTIISLRNIVEGWGNSYSFCNDVALQKNLDVWLQSEILKYHAEYLRKLSEITSKSEKTASMGMKYLSGCIKKPIYVNKKSQILNSKTTESKSKSMTKAQIVKRAMAKIHKAETLKKPQV